MQKRLLMLKNMIMFLQNSLIPLKRTLTQMAKSACYVVGNTHNY